jgi:hypothetical protein
VGKQLKQLQHKYHNKLDHMLDARVTGMLTLIQFYTSDAQIMTWNATSMMAAHAAGKGISLAQSLCKWVLDYAKEKCTYQALPHTRYGTFNTNALLDEDLSQWIHLHLQTLGPHFAAKDVVDFTTQDEMQGCMGMHKKQVSLKMAQRWLSKTHRYGYTGKGMYVDGHEREDVVKYQEEFVARWLERMRRMVGYNHKGEIVEMPNLREGESILYLVTCDESTFYENDCCQKRWVPLDEKAIPQPKGEGIHQQVVLKTRELGATRDS